MKTKPTIMAVVAIAILLIILLSRRSGYDTPYTTVVENFVYVAANIDTENYCYGRYCKADSIGSMVVSDDYVCYHDDKDSAIIFSTKYLFEKISDLDLKITVENNHYSCERKRYVFGDGDFGFIKNCDDLIDSSWCLFKQKNWYTTEPIFHGIDKIFNDPDLDEVVATDRTYLPLWNIIRHFKDPIEYGIMRDSIIIFPGEGEWTLVCDIHYKPKVVFSNDHTIRDTNSLMKIMQGISGINDIPIIQDPFEEDP